jgi:hypothetical protein
VGIDDGDSRAERDELGAPDTLTDGSGDCDELGAPDALTDGGGDCDETRLEFVDNVGSGLLEIDSDICALTDEDGDFVEDALARDDELAVAAGDAVSVAFAVCVCSIFVAVGKSLASAERDTEGDAVPDVVAVVECDTEEDTAPDVLADVECDTEGDALPDLLADDEFVADCDEMNVADAVAVGDAVPVSDGVRDGEGEGVGV